LDESTRPPAPGELHLVQLFINSHDLEEGTDLFESRDGLAAWMTRNGLGPAQRVTEAERQRVAAFREAMRALAGANNGREPAADAIDQLDRAAAALPLRVRFDGQGRTRIVPEATRGVDGMLARFLAIVADAQQMGTWPRLKACSRDICQWVFYDRSRNQSGAWCEMKICGSREKAMAYYRRRSARPSSSG
jgi:predicted RNA-binding Zn ribbon-like protein